jgi:hypothetical protein
LVETTISLAPIAPDDAARLGQRKVVFTAMEHILVISYEKYLIKNTGKTPCYCIIYSTIFVVSPNPKHKTCTIYYFLSQSSGVLLNIIMQIHRYLIVSFHLTEHSIFMRK